MTIELVIGAVKAIVIVVLVLGLTTLMLWFERKGAALIQDRIGANRADIFGIGKRFGLPNFGIINTVLADPIKMFTKEDFVPDGADRQQVTLTFRAAASMLPNAVTGVPGDEMYPKNRGCCQCERPGTMI